MRTLVVGGTGMLSGVVRQLLHVGDQVFVLARHPMRLEHAGLRPLSVDYTNLTALRQALRPLAPFDRAVVWVHGTAPEAPFLVAEYVRGPYFHVLGSASADPSRPQDDRLKRFAALGTAYREVILGSVLTGQTARWLTNAEIRAGVWQAVQHDLRRQVVGTLEPWARRP